MCERGAKTHLSRKTPTSNLHFVTTDINYIGTPQGESHFMNHVHLDGDAIICVASYRTRGMGSSTMHTRGCGSFHGSEWQTKWLFLAYTVWLLAIHESYKPVPSSSLLPRLRPSSEHKCRCLPTSTHVVTMLSGKLFVLSRFYHDRARQLRCLN
jgi:hypothetical protein